MDIAILELKKEMYFYTISNNYVLWHHYYVNINLIRTHAF